MFNHKMIRSFLAIVLAMTTAFTSMSAYANEAIDIEFVSAEQGSGITDDQDGSKEENVDEFDYDATEYDDDVVNVKSIKLSKNVLSIGKGDSRKLTVTVDPGNATDQTILWQSSDEEVATVNNGTVKAIEVGTAVITATSKDGGKTDTCTVTVTAPVIPVKQVKLDESKLTLYLGEEETATLHATVIPDDATDPSITWSSNKESVATVDTSGNVTALAAGSAEITAEANNGVKASCQVVVKRRVKSVTLSESKSGNVLSENDVITLILGEEDKEFVDLTATVLPVDATEKAVVWDTSNRSVVALESGSTVEERRARAMAPGETVITVTADGGMQAKCRIKVIQPTAGIKINLSELALSIRGDERESELLTAVFDPPNASNQNVTWKINDAPATTDPTDPDYIADYDKDAVRIDVDSANPKTVKVTAMKKGRAMITVTTEDGGKTDSCIVTVKSLVTGVTLGGNVTIEGDEKVLSFAKAGDVEQLTASVEPSDANNTEVTWISSDVSVASVDTTGKVKAMAGGTATITVVTADGGKMDYCRVTVPQKIVDVQRVSLNKSVLALDKGESETLKATVYPDEATNKAVSWSSSNESVAKVNRKTGRVTAVSEGTATITVETEDGGKTAVCEVTVTDPVIDVTGVKLDESEITLNKGEYRFLVAALEPENATNRKVTWSSSEETVATVDSQGKVEAKARGTAIITVKTLNGGKTARCTVNVVEPSKEVDITKITISNKPKEPLGVGDTIRLNVSIEPEDATNRNIQWSSSEDAKPDPVLSVDNAGVVTVLKKGTATITAATEDGSESDTCTIVITQPVTGISLDREELYLVVGEPSQSLNVKLEPYDDDLDQTLVSNTNVIWKSADDSIVEVDSTGRVTAISGGTTFVTVTSEDGDMTASCRVTVTQHVTGVTLNKPDQGEKELMLYKGARAESVTLVATVKPDTASNKDVRWVSTRPEVAEVDEDGKVTAIAEGEAVIIVITADGGKIATCPVRVKKPAEEVDVTGVDLEVPKYTLNVGESEILTAHVKPANATCRNVIWSSKHESIAVVDAGGKVTALNKGDARIQVMTEDGSKVAAVTISVVQPVSGVSLNKASHQLYEGDKVDLVATVEPYNASDDRVIWFSSNNNVATVENGRVTAVKEGRATITVETVDKKKRAECRITVKKKVPVDKVVMKQKKLTLYVGGYANLSASVLSDSGEEPTNRDCQWISSNIFVASVNPFGKVVAKAPGDVTIRVVSEDNENAADTCEVTVLQSVTKLRLDQSELLLKPGDKETLKVSIYPDNATETDLLWTSSDKTVATVDEKGMVTALADGTTTITVETEDRKKSASCTVRVESPTAAVLVESVSIDDTELSLKVGESAILTAAIKPENATNQNVTWKTSDKSVATVDKYGKVTAVAVGEAEITVMTEDGWKTDVCYVTVTDGGQVGPQNPVPVTGVRINKAALALTVDETENLIAVILPENATNKNVTWFSSDSSVASVGRYGKVTGKGQGTATITVVTDDGQMTAECVVTVTDEGQSSLGNLPVTGVALDKSNLLLVVGKAKSLAAEIIPAQAANKNVIWTSSNTAVAVVNRFGLVTAVGRGTATITVTTEDGGLTDSCIVKVIEEGDISLDPEDNSWGDILPEDRPDELDEIPYGLWIAGIDRKGYLYTGDAIRPEVRVYNRNKRLIENLDYTISYQSNVNANDGSLEYKNVGMPTVVIRGKGNYTGEERVGFRILPIDISTANPLVVAGSVCVPFTQKYQKPVPDLWYDGKKLNNGTDFSCTYQDTSGNTVECGNSGNYRIAVKGMRNYTGTRIVDMLIANYGQKVLADAVIAKIADKPYAGRAIEPDDLKVTYDGKVLSEDMYDVKYLNNIMVGTAYVIISANDKGMGLGYVGQKTAEFNIIGNEIKTASIAGIEDKVYNGGKQTQDVRIVHGVDNNLLYEGVDYKIDYTDNTNIGKATMVITGIGAYTGTVKKTFKIKSCHISDPEIEVTNVGDFKYTKGGCTPEPKVIFTDKGGNRITLVPNRDYTVSYKKNKSLNTNIESKNCAYIVIKGKGNFTGKRKVYFTVDQQDLAALSLVVPNKSYSTKKKGWKSPVKIYDLNGKTLSAGKDYKRAIEYTCGGVPVKGDDVLPVGSEITVTVTATGKKYSGVLTGTYRIVEKSISRAQVSVKNPDMKNRNQFEYTGKPIKLKKENLSVIVGGNILTPDQFDILEGTYKNNVKTGTASVKIQGKGDYGGSVTVRYRIAKKDISWWWRD